MNPKAFNIIFWGIFSISLISIIVQMVVVGWLGVTAVKEVQDNNGSVGQTIGKFIGDVQKGMKSN